MPLLPAEVLRDLDVVVADAGCRRRASPNAA